jgi:hypothetical protein
MRACSGQRAENRPESTHFVRKSGDFHYSNRTTVLTDLHRKMRAGAIAAPPAAADALGPRGESRRNSVASHHARANSFRKSEYVLFSSSKAERKFAGAA